MEGAVGVVPVQRQIQHPGGAEQHHQQVERDEVAPGEQTVDPPETQHAHQRVHAEAGEESGEEVEVNLPGLLPHHLENTGVEGAGL